MLKKLRRVARARERGPFSTSLIPAQGIVFGIPPKENTFCHVWSKQQNTKVKPKEQTSIAEVDSWKARLPSPQGTKEEACLRTVIPDEREELKETIDQVRMVLGRRSYIQSTLVNLFALRPIPKSRPSIRPFGKGLEHVCCVSPQYFVHDLSYLVGQVSYLGELPRNFGNPSNTITKASSHQKPSEPDRHFQNDLTLMLV